MQIETFNQKGDDVSADLEHIWLSEAYLDDVQQMIKL